VGGGEATGVIPRNLHERNVAFTELPDLHVVGTMLERFTYRAPAVDKAALALGLDSR
jgi:hypothetical protein